MMKNCNSLVSIIASFSTEIAAVFILVGCMLSIYMLVWIVGAVVAMVASIGNFFTCSE